MIHVYSTLSSNSSFREVKKFLKEHNVKFVERKIYKDPTDFLVQDYLAILHGLAFTYADYEVTCARLLTERVDPAIVEILDNASPVEATVFLRENMHLMKATFTVDFDRDVALSGFRPDESTVFLSRKEKNAIYKEVRKKVAELDAKKTREQLEEEETHVQLHESEF